MSVGALLERVSSPEPGILVLREVDGQTVEGAAITLGRISELAEEMDHFAVIVDLSEVPTRPASDYREFMEKWAMAMPPFHTAYVLPPVGAITRMALRWVALRVLKVHPESTSSNHDSVAEAVAHCRRHLAQRREA